MKSLQIHSRRTVEFDMVRFTKLGHQLPVDLLRRRHYKDLVHSCIQVRM